ncbi:hypothetical protein [Pantanalinema rosaneae]|uniref:hypothetical protein n=1 Tax=Pantanalinema rosaneae TaxID=1620701 RepID=UPI003D6F240B
MNQQRLQAYIQLIQKLLACPSGEEWILLRQHEALVTPELVQVMEQVAAQLAHQNNLKEAKFLHNLAGQIHHLFVAQTVPRSSNDDDHAQAYLELIKALLECPQGAENELLKANPELIEPGLVQMMQQVATQLATNGDREAANYLQHWAMAVNHLWLQQHNFQPTFKQDPEPNHPQPTDVAPPSPPQEQSASTQTAIPSSMPSTPEDDDPWAELSGEVVQTPPQPQSAPSAKPPASSLTQEKPPPASAAPDIAIYEQINRHLATIATALTQLSETIAPPAQPPTNPLWYMEILERANVEHWILTSTEIQQLIGVQPSCAKGSESFQRGCWVFVKAGKLGNQTAWQVKKDSAFTSAL